MTWINQRGKRDVQGQLLPSPVPPEKGMTIEQLSGTTSWKQISGTNAGAIRQMLAAVLYGGATMTQAVMAFGEPDEKKAEKIAAEILSHKDVQKVIALLHGKA